MEAERRTIRRKGGVERGNKEVKQIVRHTDSLDAKNNYDQKFSEEDLVLVLTLLLRLGVGSHCKIILLSIIYPIKILIYGSNLSNLINFLIVCAQHTLTCPCHHYPLQAFHMKRRQDRQIAKNVYFLGSILAGVVNSVVTKVVRS